MTAIDDLHTVEGGQCIGDYLIKIEDVLPFDICLIPWRSL